MKFNPDMYRKVPSRIEVDALWGRFDAALAAIQLSLPTTGVNLDFAIGRRYATAIEPRLKIANLGT
jgi:hypothetical protein